MKKIIRITAVSLILAMTMALTACNAVRLLKNASEAGKNDEPAVEEGDKNIIEASPDEEYAEGRIGNLMRTMWFDFTVTDAAIADDYHGYAPAEGEELVVVTVDLKNTYTASLPMWDYDFQLTWGSGDDEFSYPVTDGGNVETVYEGQMPGEYSLGIDQKATYEIVYPAPAGQSDFSLWFVENIDDGSEEGKEGNYFAVFFTARK